MSVAGNVIKIMVQRSYRATYVYISISLSLSKSLLVGCITSATLGCGNLYDNL